MTTEAIGPLELLRELGDEFRHVQQEHQRQPVHGATRHRLERQLRAILDRFERLLDQWVSDADLRGQWREFLQGRADPPAQPSLPRPPLFKGQTDAGAVLELRPASGGYDVIVDQVRVDHSSAPWHLDPDMLGRVQIGGYACDEVFDAPPEARQALAEFVAGRSAPPWPWAPALIADGLIDAELALTPRGERSLQRARPMTKPAPRARTFCVLVADAARARVLVLEQDRSSVGPAVSELVEVAMITNPMLRARDADAVAESRPGLRREGPHGPIHGVSDRRESRRRELERHFAARVAEEAAGVWRRYAWCELIVVAGPVTLGLLRAALNRQIVTSDQLRVHELVRDLSKLSAPALHDQLADAQLLPERGRRAPVLPTPGLPT